MTEPFHVSLTTDDVDQSRGIPFPLKRRDGLPMGVAHNVPIADMNNMTAYKEGLMQALGACKLVRDQYPDSHNSQTAIEKCIYGIEKLLRNT